MRFEADGNTAVTPVQTSNLGRLITFKDNRFFTIRLGNGEFIYFSVSQKEFVVYKSILWGLLPWQRVFAWPNNESMMLVIEILGEGFTKDKSWFQCARDKVLTIWSIREFKSFLLKTELAAGVVK